MKSLHRDRQGVAAIEFAFIVPVLLCMYFITMEASQALEANRKVSRIGSMVADLITQQTATSVDEVVAIMQIGKSLIQPYNRTKEGPQIEVTAIQFDGNSTPTATVLWSVKLNSSGNPEHVVTKNTVINDAQLADLRAPGAFYIRVTSKLDYNPMLTWSEKTEPVGLPSAFSNINMAETFYLRPRYSSTDIKCESCP